MGIMTVSIENPKSLIQKTSAKPTINDLVDLQDTKLLQKFYILCTTVGIKEEMNKE